LRITAPDAIAIYDVADTGTTPARVQSIGLTTGARKTYRAVARKNEADLGGALRVQWTSSNPAVVSVDTVATSGVRVTLVANKEGAATLTVTGGTFEQAIAVQVTP
jgi:hypothetical protein